MQEEKNKEKLIDQMTNMVMHDVLHLPIKGYGFDKNGKQILIKEVHRRCKECPRCDELYKDLPVPTSL